MSETTNDHFAKLAVEAIEKRCRERAISDRINPDGISTGRAFDFSALAADSDGKIPPQEEIQYPNWMEYRKREQELFSSLLAYFPIAMSMLTQEMQRARVEADRAAEEVLGAAGLDQGAA